LNRPGTEYALITDVPLLRLVAQLSEIDVAKVSIFLALVTRYVVGVEVAVSYVGCFKVKVLEV